MSEMVQAIAAEVVERQRSERPSLADPDAERAVLAAVLLADDGGADVMQRVGRILGEQDFTQSAYAETFAAFAAIAARGEPVDLITAARELTARRRFNAIGGAQFLGEITDTIPTVAHVETHALIVADLSARRRIATLAAALYRRAHDLGASMIDVRDGAANAIRGVSVPGAPALTLGDDLIPLWDHIRAVGAGEVAPNIATGVPGLDRILGGGFVPGKVYLLAARPRVGKTALAVQVGLNVAERGEVVFMASLEIDAQDITRQAIGCLGCVDHSRLAKAELNADEMQRATSASNRLYEMPFYRVEGRAPGCPRTVAAIGAAALALPKRPTLAIIDHVGKIEARGRYREPAHAMREVSSDLIAFARQSGIALLCLAHINRDGSDRPTLDTLAESDALGKDADGVILMHRPDLALKLGAKPKPDEEKPEPMVAYVAAAKVRGDAVGGVCKMRLRGEWQRWEPMGVDADEGEVGW